MPNSGLCPKSRYKADTGLSLSLISLMAKFPLFVLALEFFFLLRLNSPKISQSQPKAFVKPLFNF